MSHLQAGGGTQWLLQGRRRLRGFVTREGLSCRSGCRPHQPFPACLHIMIIFWLPKRHTATTLAPTDYLFTIENVTNICWQESLLGEMAEVLLQWMLRPREAFPLNSTGPGQQCELQHHPSRTGFWQSSAMAGNFSQGLQTEIIWWREGFHFLWSKYDKIDTQYFKIYLKINITKVTHCLNLASILEEVKRILQTQILWLLWSLTYIMVLPTTEIQLLLKWQMTALSPVVKLCCKLVFNNTGQILLELQAGTMGNTRRTKPSQPPPTFSGQAQVFLKLDSDRLLL